MKSDLGLNVRGESRLPWDAKFLSERGVNNTDGRKRVINGRVHWRPVVELKKPVYKESREGSIQNIQQST